MQKICLESEKLPVLSARQTEESDCPLGHAHLGDTRKRPGAMVSQSEPTLGQAVLVKLPGVGWGEQCNYLG